MSEEKHIQDIKQIRTLMEHSTKFISLSGMSGILAGIYSLIGAYLVDQRLSQEAFIPRFADEPKFYAPYVVIAASIVILSILTGVFFTQKRAKQNGQSLFDKTSIRMLVYIGYPLAVGAVFCAAMLYHGQGQFIAPAMLIFYGLGLINGSKYTFNDIRILGAANTLLGLPCLFMPKLGLEFWATGFGVLHIVYGSYMYFKYEKK